MIVLKLMGGLGNQLFQYAYALSLSKEYGEEIVFDTCFYPEGKKLALYDFNVPKHENWITVIPEAERRKAVKAQMKYRVLQKAKRMLLHTEELGEVWFRHSVDKGYYFNFDPYFYPFLRTEQPNKYVYGYFQSEKYFTNCVDLVKESFQLSAPLGESAIRIQQEVSLCNSVALHVRLGDYKKARNRHLDVCTPQYYQKALKSILQNVDHPKVFVFTNDAEGVDKIVELPKTSFIVQGTKDFEDFELIRSCRYAILSNSSFSWWAAYLSRNMDKVIVPTPWLSTLKRDSDIYMRNMLKIEV